jgi:hypothetical protein
MPSSTTDPSTSQPLLHEDRQSSEPNSSSSDERPKPNHYNIVYNICKQKIQAFLSSRAQHYTVLGLVSFDLLGIFADIIINLYQCDEKDTDPIWDDVRFGLGIAGLVFSCLFMLELILSVCSAALAGLSIKELVG